ncbi:MAG: RNA polymerase sigma factor [Actinomycetota bacterium]
MAATPQDGAPDIAGRFEDFYAAEYTALTRLAYVLCGSAPVAEELVHTTMLRAHRNWEKVAAHCPPRAWARRFLCNLATSPRRRVAEALVKVRVHPAQAIVDPREETAEVWHAVRRLPARAAHVMALGAVEDLPIDEIALILERTPDTVESLRQQARAALAQQLGEPIDNGRDAAGESQPQ